MPLQALFQWITIGAQVLQSGTTALSAVKTALAANGIDADTSALDAVIADAERRKKLADAETSAAQ